MENKAENQHFRAVWSDHVDSSRIRSYESHNQRKKPKNSVGILSHLRTSVFFSQSVTFEEHFWLSKRALFGPLLERFGPPVDARYEKCSFWSVWTSGGCTLSNALTSGGCTEDIFIITSSFSFLPRLRRSRKKLLLTELFIFPSGFFF